ncbi:MAG TPA: hypothetical protein VN025_15250 [Candidatus Dormibacteraeota bacterium]|jgi:hypothetical protein|nr:hypothetical protein [Candidatus Dormibacteraeota bacterium]
MGRTLSIALICAFLACGPVRADDSNTGDAGGKTATATATDKAASGTAAKTEKNKTEAAKPAADYREEIEELRQLMREQSQQLAEQQKQLELLREQLSATHKSEVSVSAPAADPTAVHVTGTDMGIRPEAKTTEAAQGDKPKQEEGPSSIHYKGINITPGGFIAAETVFRTRATSADVNTPFTGIPFPGNSLSKVTEANFTGRQSRATLLAESKIGSAKLTGYYEADFLGAGTTSNNRQSNSYVFRQRQLFGQVALDNGLSITGGQMWSLVAENRKGIQNRQEALPMVIDPQYNVGFTWARQYGFRIVKDFGGKFAVGVSVEGPQTTLGGRGFSTVTAANGTTSLNFFTNAPGAGGGLYNAFDATGYSVNKAPDFIFKAAADPGFGHYEVFGIVSTFRNRIYPCAIVSPAATNGSGTVVLNGPALAGTSGACTNTSPSSVGAFQDTRTGGGLGASARWSVFNKKVDFGIKGVAGDGIGRYGSAQLADLTARPDGTQALIRTAHGLGILEFHPNPKLDIYAYYGGEYAWRAAYTGYLTDTITTSQTLTACTAGSPGCPNGDQITTITTHTTSNSKIGGYGSPFANNTGCSSEGVPSGTFTPSGGGTCAGDIRFIQEGTLGFWHKFYQGSKGGMRWGIQYSYITKSGWSGNNNVPTSVGIQPKAVDNMVFTSFRYYLP